MNTSENTNTVSLHRILAAPVERLYRAFTEADAKVRWEPPFGFIGQIDEWDFRVGGRYRTVFVNFATGARHGFGGEILEIVENEKIVVSDSFDNPELPGTMRTTVTFRPVVNGAELRIEQRGVPAEIPPELCYAGWQQSLVQLAQLVEAEIPDAPTS